MSSSRGGFFVQLYAIATTIGVFILATVFFLSVRDQHKREAALVAAKDQLVISENALRDSLDQIERLKKALNYKQDQVGFFEADQANTVLGSLYDDLSKLPQITEGLNVKSSITALEMARNDLLTEREQLRRDVGTLKQELEDERRKWNESISRFEAARKRAEGDLADRITTHEEQMASKQKKIEDLQEVAFEAEQQLAAINEQLKILQQERDKEKRLLQNTIARLQRDLAIARGDKIDLKPDGAIVRIASNRKIAWINRGTADKLRVGVPFAVFDKDETGERKPKGKLEVVRLLGDHLAEAQLTPFEISNPVVSGDVVASALWTPGQSQRFAIAGIVDLDGDGRSDLDRLKTMIEKSGAELVTYIDDEGNLHGEPIDASINNLVIGLVPDPSKTKLQTEINRRLRIGQQFSALQSAARDHGVPLVSWKRFVETLRYEAGG